MKKFKIKGYTTYIVIIFVILGVFFWYRRCETFKNLENTIPKDIYMCYKTKNIPSKVIHNWKKLNPDYNIHLYDDNDCYMFLKDNYSKDYADFFNEIPDGPIKSDFWRICILYKKGGVYSDIDIKPLVPLKDFVENNIELLTVMSWMKKKNGPGITPELIISKPNNLFLKKCIDTFIKKRGTKYSYWGWSICGIMYENIGTYLPTIKHKDGIYYDINNKKYQFLLEVHDKNYHKYHCVYKNKKILMNRYDDYINHKFI